MSAATTTTEILFNSPALHSLKRDQLVKLCKIHSIKASGKNIELIERLKKVAESLPRDAPLSVAARSEDVEIEEEVAEGKENQAYPVMTMKTLPRPSEQWDVMESIQESDLENEETGSGQGTLKSLRSNREFGTADSKSSNSTVTSSIKALASSLGLKRGTSAKSSFSATTHDGSSYLDSTPPVPPLPKHRRSPLDELSLNSKPYSQIPVPSPSQLPQTDHFADFGSQPTASDLAKFDFHNTEDSAPLPGHVLRPGQPAPENARLSLGLGPAPNTPARKGPTTTIRLISSSSVQGTDESHAGYGVSGGSGSQVNEPQTPQLKPFNTTFDLILGSPVDDMVVGSQNSVPPTAGAVPGALPPASGALSPPSITATSSQAEAKPEPFVFGSPQHRVSNSQFQSAAASVLGEMNRRLLADGVDTVGSSIITNLKPGSSAELTPGTKGLYTNGNKDGREIKPLRKSMGGVKREVKEKFEKAHQEQFDGMESIAGYINRKNNSTITLGKGGVASRKATDEQDKESVQIVGKKRKSSALGDLDAGGFGDDDDDEDEGQPVGKKPRVEFTQNDESGKLKEEGKDDKEKSEKEREAIRRRLEMNRARRRSSAAARASTGRGRASGRVSVGRGVLQKPPPAAKSRFGFLSSAAKSIVRGVWGGVGGGTKKKTTVTSGTTNVTSSATATTSKSAPTQSTNAGTSAAPPAKRGMSQAPGPRVQRKVSVTNPSGAVPRPSTAASSSGSTLRVPSTTRSHARTASMLGIVTSLGSVATHATNSSARSRSPIPSFDISRTNSVRTSTSGTASTRNSLAKGTSSSRVSSVTGSSSKVSSLGARGTLMSTGAGTTSSQSRLLAPTASSLAKTNANGLNKTKSTVVSAHNGRSGPLEGVTNTTGATNDVDTKATSGVAPGKIFSKPLVVPPGSGIPSPVRNAGVPGSSGSTASVARSNTAATNVSRQRSLQGRKPRISRSKVIAKLASQRAASGSGSQQNNAAAGPSLAAPGLGTAGKRSSLGVGVHKAPRKSFGGARRSHVGVALGRGSDVEAAVLLSAKKRIRQSEYARRRSSRAVGGRATDEITMDVDS